MNRVDSSFTPTVRAVRAVLGVVAVACIATGLQTIASAEAQDGDDRFVRRPYVGVGAGVTRLEPKSRSEALEVGDENDTGVHLFAGYDITRWLSAEVYFADLGAAGIDFLGRDVGDVDYRVFGVNAVGYLYNSRSGFGLSGRRGPGLDTRTGLSLFLTTGLGGMDNDSELDYRQDYGTHVAFGGGLEYGFDNGLALRAELQSFDTDAQYANLSVLARFGGRGDRSTSRPAAEPVAAVAPTPDPVAPPRPSATLPDGPTFFRPIVPPYLYFGFDSADLDVAATDKLDAFIAEIRDTGFAIAVDGHADRVGPEAYNETLSEQRARVVRDYLLAAGIPADRLEARAFGERQPLSSNATAQGRSENRRTEFVLR